MSHQVTVKIFHHGTLIKRCLILNPNGYRVTPEEAPADTSWLPFMVGCVSGVTLISFCITIFMLYR